MSSRIIKAPLIKQYNYASITKIDNIIVNIRQKLPYKYCYIFSNQIRVLTVVSLKKYNSKVEQL